jgi:hypothetical protein
VYTTEDGVRYTFFAALLSRGVAPERIVLEHEHPGLPGAKKVDTVIYDEAIETPVEAIEFKYHRASSAGSAQPRPAQAGAALADIGRLLHLAGSALQRYLILLADGDMSAYLIRPRNGLAAVFALHTGSDVEVGPHSFATQSPTLRKAIGVWPCRACLEVLRTENLPHEHRLWILRVTPTAVV